MLVEPIIFRGDERLLHTFGYFADGDRRTPLFTKLCNEAAIARIDLQRSLEAYVLQALGRGELGQRPPCHADDHTDRQGEAREQSVESEAQHVVVTGN